MEHRKVEFVSGLYTNYLSFNGWLYLTKYKPSTSLQKVASLIPMLIAIFLAPPYIIFQIISFFKLKYDLVTASEIICMIIPLMICQIKNITFLYHRRDIQDLLQLLTDDLLVFSSNETRLRGNAILKKFVKKTNFFVVLFVVLELLPITAWECMPLFLSASSGNVTTVNKFLPGWYPWDYSKFPGYHAAFLYETSMASFNSFYQISSNVLLYQLILMLCGHIAVLTDSFERLKELDNPKSITNGMKISYRHEGVIFTSSLITLICEDEKILARLKECVENHQKVLRLSKKLNKVYSVLVGADILLALFLFCLILFQLTSVPEKQSLGDIIKSLTFLGSATSLIFIVCWLGSELEKTSLSLQNGVFDSGWPVRDVRLNSLLPTVLLVSCRPLTLSAGYTYNANLELFASTMRFAYSFYTVLVNVQQG